LQGELSLEEHAEHLVLQHAEIDARGGAAEVGPALLAVLDLAAALPVVGVGEVGVGVAVAALSNSQIAPPSEYRPPAGAAADQSLSPCGTYFSCWSKESRKARRPSSCT
jgi:hypothetical protein